MKKSTLTALLALGLTEISASTPAEAQGVDTFTGPYVGAHTGRFTGDATFKSAPYTVTTPPSLGTNTILFPGRNDPFDFDGALVGVHGGIGFLVGNNLVGGVEADWTSLNDGDFVSATGPIRSASNDGFSFQRRSEIDLEWQSTIRGRLGFVLGNTLFFGTAGVAFLHMDWSETTSLRRTGGAVSVNLDHSDDETLVGGAVGGGVEVALTPTTILGVDYLYEDFESFSSVPHGFVSTQSGEIDDINIQKVRVRLSVKLGGAPPQ